jgi:hypothetical protein
MTKALCGKECLPVCLLASLCVKYTMPSRNANATSNDHAAAAGAIAAVINDRSRAVSYLAGIRPCSSPCVPGSEPKGPKPRKEKKMIE